MTVTTNTEHVARLYHGAGLNPIPCSGKQPTIRWRQFEDRRMSDAELSRHAWRFANSESIGLVCGNGSQLYVIDYDVPHAFDRHKQVATEFGCWPKNNPVIRTPHGYHLHLKVSRKGMLPNQVLAMFTEKGAPKKAIETRGQGGQVIAPSPNNNYQQISGIPLDEWARVPTTRTDQLQSLLALARAQTEHAKDPEQERYQAGEGNRPGDHFNAKGDFSFLTEFGWEPVREYDGVTYWRKPGSQKRGWHATSGRAKSSEGYPLFYNFSTDAPPLEPERGYLPFTLFTSLKYGGNASMAAAELQKQGFGNGPKPTTTRIPATDEEWPDPVPFDQDPPPPELDLRAAIPDGLNSLRDFIRATSICYQYPSDAVALHTLSIASYPASRTMVVQPQPGWQEPVNLWGLVLLPSGERKSAVSSELLAPLANWQHEQAEEMRGEIAKHENKIAIKEKQLRAAQQNASKGQKAKAAEMSAESHAAELAELKADAPRVPRGLVTEATPEALAQTLVENNERALLASAEADAFGVMLGRYSRNGAPHFGTWLQAHSGDSVEIRRRTRESDHLRSPALAMAISAQPEAMTALYADEQAQGSGMLARIQVCCPQSRVGYRELTPPDIAPDNREYWDDLQRSLLSVEPSDNPRIVRFSEVASDLFIEFRDHIEADLRPNGRLSERREWGSKLPGAIARIAGVLHAMQAGGDEIDAYTMQAALSWSEWLIAHEGRVRSAVSPERDMVNARKLARWIKRKKLVEFSRRDAHSENRCTSIERVTDVDPALALLTEYGWIEQAPKSGNSIRFKVNPKLKN